MTTITTPMKVESRRPRPVLLAVASAVFGAAIGLGVGTLIDSDSGPAVADPVPAVITEAVSGSDAPAVDFRLERLLGADGPATPGVPAVDSAVASAVDFRLERLLGADGPATPGVPAVASVVDFRLERLLG